MSSNGWICLHRKMLQTSWYRKHPDATLVAVHLLLSATHKDIDFKFSTQKGRLLRGQYVTGRHALAEETGVCEGRIRKALLVLESVGFLTRKSTNKYSIITICNYNAYQDADPDIDQQFNQQVVVYSQQGGSPQPAGGHPVSTKQQLTINNKQYLLSEFELLWEAYPKKIGKKDALRHFLASMKKEEDLVNIKQALVNYKNSRFCVEEGGRFIKHGSSWFNNWRDWVTDPEPKDDAEVAKFKALLNEEKKDAKKHESSQNVPSNG